MPPKRRSFRATAPGQNPPLANWRKIRRRVCSDFAAFTSRRSGAATTDAAIHFAQEAHKIAPLPWSAKAVLDHHAAKAQWESALAALESHIAAKLVDKKTGERQRAVLETAVALDKAAQRSG